MPSSSQSTAAMFSKNTSASYDARQQRFGPMMDHLHFLIRHVLSGLSAQAHILCVGVGTGTEIIKLAQAYPHWQFTGLDISADMLEVCREQLEAHGIASRCTLFHGSVAELPSGQSFDATLCLLVTQFIKDETARQAMFDAMASRMLPSGYLINAEISDDLASPLFADRLEKWKAMHMAAGDSAEQAAKILPMWQEHLSILPPKDIEYFLRQSGFTMPVQFFQSLLICAWYSQKA